LAVDHWVARHAGLLANLPLETCHTILLTAECGHEAASSTASLAIVMYSFPERSQIALKWLTSFTKSQWRFSDYPRRVRPNNVDDPAIAWIAQFLNWPGPIGLGASPAEAVTKLYAMFEEVRLARETNGKPLPRPGTAEPIRFASSDRVTTDPALLEDFIQGILGFGSNDPVFISDESSLLHCGSDEDVERYCGLILSRYGIDVSDLEGLIIAEILEKVRRERQDGSQASHLK
jgi:hypothetical protein